MDRLANVLLILAGFGLVIAGFWLAWDLVNSIVPWVRPEWWQEWCFPLPFFVYCVPARTWTLVYDIALALGVLGTALLVVGVYREAVRRARGDKSVERRGLWWVRG